MTHPTLQQLAPDGHDMARDPYPVYAMLRAKGPVHRVLVPGSGECLLVVARDAARAALSDRRLRNDIRHSSSWETDGGHAVGRNMLQSDPPQHTTLRRLVAEHFAPRRIAALRPAIEAVADGLLADLPRLGTVDLVSRFALPLPVTVICELLGVPVADRADFHSCSNQLVVPASSQAAAAAAADLTGFLTELTARKAAAPDGTLLADLAAAGLTAEELLGMAFLLLVAGHETTVNLISGTVHALLADPSQLALVQNDLSLVPAAVEESLRHNAPVHAAAFRFAAEPLDLAGTHVAAGEAVQVSLAAASRDPLYFPDPDRFDLTRRPQGHLAFGHGLHHCLGAALARMEATVALSLLVRQRRSMTLTTDPALLNWRSGTLVRGLGELPIDMG
nr:cytochrome P450 [Streptomyces sp. HGB0020]